MVQRLPPSVLRAHNSEDSGIFLPFYSKQRRLLYRLLKATERCFRLCLSSVFRRFRLHLFFKDLVRSFEISAPRPLHHSPPWDLDKVLEYLSDPPFEPLAEASFSE